MPQKKTGRQEIYLKLYKQVFVDKIVKTKKATQTKRKTLQIGTKQTFLALLVQKYYAIKVNYTFFGTSISFSNSVSVKFQFTSFFVKQNFVKIKKTIRVIKSS